MFQFLLVNVSIDYTKDLWPTNNAILLPHTNCIIPTILSEVVTRCPKSDVVVKASEMGLAFDAVLPVNASSGCSVE